MKAVPVALWIALAGATVAAAKGPQPPDFTRDVRPILSEHCFKCHGPDDAARQAKLRLDLRDAALAKTGSGNVPIVPGKPDASEVVRRILSHDADEMMPPPAANKPLSDEEETYSARLDCGRGAVSGPLGLSCRRSRRFLPSVHNAQWPRNPIDRFILGRLESAGLKPAAEADRYTLVRRVSLDLTGLPPTPEEADAFVNDRSPDAYERLVDRLLASPHYGERWASTGWIWLAMPTRTDTKKIACGRSGRIATG